MSGSNRELQQAVERFLMAADQGDPSRIASIYSPDFINIRVSDDGGFAQLTGPQILTILGQSSGGNHTIPARETVIHHAEIVGDNGFVLMTRMKDQPMFHSLVWQKRNGQWLLVREFIRQKDFPTWS